MSPAIRVPLSSVISSPSAKRLNSSSSYYALLLKDVRRWGILYPINVQETFLDGERVYIVLDGEHRFAAAVECGHSEIEVRVIQSV